MQQRLRFLCLAKHTDSIEERLLERVWSLLNDDLEFINLVGGEAFLWTPLKSFVAKAMGKCPRLKLRVVSNGTTFDTHWFEQIEKGAFGRISISINASDRDLYKKIHGVDRFDIVIATLAKLADIRTRVNFDLEATAVLTKSLLGYLDELVKLLAGRVAKLTLHKIQLSSNPANERFCRDEIVSLENTPELQAILDRCADLAESKSLKFCCRRVCAARKIHAEQGSVPMRDM